MSTTRITPPIPGYPNSRLKATGKLLRYCEERKKKERGIETWLSFGVQDGHAHVQPDRIPKFWVPKRLSLLIAGSHSGVACLSDRLGGRQVGLTATDAGAAS